MTKLREMTFYLVDNNLISKEGFYLDYEPNKLAFDIGTYAHRNQKRINGEKYFEHSLRCYLQYQILFNIFENFGLYPNKELLKECNIPYDGVEEVCYLHDVIEDTDISMEDIESMYKECNLDDYFIKYVKEPLSLITHDKKDSYIEYINQVLDNPVSSFVKLLDLYDNLNFLTLDKFDSIYHERCKRYLEYIKMINDKYHFIEGINKYVIESNKRKENKNE